MSALNIALPRFDYMSQNNTYTGSQGAFRYKFFPEKQDDGKTLLVAACYMDNCYEVELEAGRVVRAEFDHSEQGIDAAQAWICEQYAERMK